MHRERGVFDFPESCRLGKRIIPIGQLPAQRSGGTQDFNQKYLEGEGHWFYQAEARRASTVLWPTAPPAQRNQATEDEKEEDREKKKEKKKMMKRASERRRRKTKEKTTNKNRSHEDEVAKTKTS